MHTHAMSRRQFMGMGLAGLLGAGLLPGRVQFSVRGQDGRKRIYLALDDHTDYLWTADEETYRRVFLETLDFYLDLTDSTQNESSEFQSRWNCDGSYWLWTYEKNRSPEEFERLIERIRSGHVSVPLNALPVLLGGASAETVIRGMYFSGHIERRYNLRFPLVYSMENQTLPYGLVSLWAGSGGRYSWKGICNCATQIPDAGNRQHPIYWWEGPDGSRVLMKWYNFYSNEGIGGYAEARNPDSVLDIVENNADFQTHYPYDVIGAFGKGWDDLETLTDEFVTFAKARTNDRHQIIVSNEADFFEDFEASYGAEIPVVRVGYGNEWELYNASMAEVSASVRRSVEKLRSAEAMAALVWLQDPTFMDGRNEARDLAWMNLGLYYDHDWTADSPHVAREVRGDWQRRLAGEIAAYVDTLHTDSATALGGLIQAPSENPCFFVFNPLSWTRTDYSDLPYTGPDDIHVVDATSGHYIAWQFETVDEVRYLRILAADVPPLGYKAFEIRPGLPDKFPAIGPSMPTSGAASANGTANYITLENTLYSVTLNERGAISSLTDRTGREFVREIDGALMNDIGAGNMTYRVENHGPVSTTIRGDVTGPLSRIVRLTLYHDIDRIDIHNTITQNFSDTLAWRFSFALDNPQVWHEEVGAVIPVMLDSEGGPYASRSARYDWLTLNHFVAILGADSGVTLSNADCQYMRVGSSTPTSLDTTTPQISVLAGGQVDGANLGIQNQGGDSTFVQRFALRTHDSFGLVSAMRFALEHQNPLVAAPISGGTAYPETSRAFISLSDDNVLLWAFKPAEDGDGLIARAWNLSQTPVECRVDLPSQNITQAQETTHLETPLADVPVAENAIMELFNQQQMRTFRFQVE